MLTATSSSLTASICSAVSSGRRSAIADQQREIGQAVDLPRDAVAEVVERFERVGREDFARGSGRLEPVADVDGRFLGREGPQERANGNTFGEARQPADG